MKSRLAVIPAAVLALGKKLGARDVFLFGGLSLLCLGAGMVYLPAAPIIAGAAFLSLGLFGVPSWR